MCARPKSRIELRAPADESRGLRWHGRLARLPWVEGLIEVGSWVKLTGGNLGQRLAKEAGAAAALRVEAGVGVRRLEGE